MDLENFKEIEINGELYTDYLVNDQGQIFSKKSNRLLKASINKITGYYRVGLIGKDKKLKTFHVHTLVAKMYIPNPYNYTDVDHINGNKADNRVSNLQRIPHNLNCMKGHLVDTGVKAKITIVKTKAKTKGTHLMDQFNNSFKSTYDASEKIGCDQSLVAKALKFGSTARGRFFKRVKDSDNE